MRLIFAALLALSLLAQPPAASPERKAFSAAVAEKDPARRLAALEKFLADYPAAGMAATARREIVSSLIKSKPEAAPAKAAAFAKTLSPADAAALYRHLATELNTAGQLPAEAEKAARRALKLLRFPAFAEQAKADAQRFKMPAPTGAQLRARYSTQRALITETLAQSLAANSKTSKSLKAFREALAANPTSTAAARALAEAEDKAGRTEPALAYFAHALLAKPSPESRQRFAEAWKKARPAQDGAEAYLDKRYRELFPNPIHLPHYQKSAARSNRLVLAEIYTGAGCPPCVGADLAFDSILERYPRTDVAVLMYHEHIPRPDPLTNSDTLARWKWQQGRGVPTYAIDGQVSERGGGARDSAPDLESYIRASIHKQLETPAGAQLELRAANDGRSVRATARVLSIGKPNPNLVLNVALVEKEVRYSGENGVRFHPMVVRRIHTVALKDTATLAEAHAFSLDEVAGGLKLHLDDFEKHDERHNKDGKFRFMERKESIDPAALAVVAFVQNTETKEVLQAAWADAPKE